MMHPITVAAIQMVSSTDPKDNLTAMRHLVRQAAKQGANWVLLPEYWSIMGQHDTDKLTHAEHFGTGILQTALSEIAAECHITLFGGTIPLKSNDPNKVFNTLLIYDKSGKCQYRYDKIHLFGYSGLGERYAESDTIKAGIKIPQYQIDGCGIAQGICYDIRFPEFFRAQAPFDVLLLPAAFTYTTGKAHWELLLRTRAVENQCYVIASGQGGKHQNGRQTFGHSMIIDPWGDIIDVLPEGEGMVITQLDPNRLHSIRNRLPALQHRFL